MKSTISLLIVLLLAVSLMACKKEETAVAPVPSEKTAVVEQEQAAAEQEQAAAEQEQAPAGQEQAPAGQEQASVAAAEQK